MNHARFRAESQKRHLVENSSTRPRRPEPKVSALDNDLAHAVETGLELVANHVEIVFAVAVGLVAEDVDALAPDLLGDKPIAHFRANNDFGAGPLFSILRDCLLAHGACARLGACRATPCEAADLEGTPPMRSSSPQRALKRSRSMTPQQGLRMQTRKAMRSRTVIRPLSCQSSTQGRSTRRSDRAWSCTPICSTRRLEARPRYCAGRARSWRDHRGIDRCDGLVCPHDPCRADRPFHDGGGVRRAARRDRHGARLVG